jgi:cell division protein FtsI/penicillin-binding protein 2
MKNYTPWRISVVSAALFLFLVLIIAQIIRIQTSENGKRLSLNADQQYAYEKHTIYPERGNIYDRWGHLLAGNKEVYEIGVDLRYVQNPSTIASTLASVLGSDYSTILSTASIPWKEGKNEYAVLADFVAIEKINEISKIMDGLGSAPTKANEPKPSLSGLIWTPHLQRSYPENTLGSNILGFYSFKDREKGRGFFGIEEKFNDLLAGTPVDILVPKDPYLLKDIPTIAPGASLTLTIDRAIQASVEQILDKAVETSGSTSGTIIVTNPKTGEVLAMATTPRLDPNQYWTYEDVFPKPTPYNRAVSETYEPGSIFKVLTMAAALDSNTVTPDTPFLDTGVINVGGINIFNWDRAAYGPQTMTGCMQHSLNVCLAWVAEQLGTTRFYDYLQRFGVGTKTGVDLAGEVNWPLSMPGESTWYPVNLGTNAFGQGVAVTPMGMVMAASSLANHGKMMAPHVLKSVINNGRQYNNSPQVVGSPISAQSADTETEMLAQSLELESSKALVDGYRLAGKTGTAQIPSPDGYLSNLTNADFVGWGPADDPQFFVYVWLEKPKSSIWGSIVAAPVFRDVVRSLVVLMDIPPDKIRLGLQKQ